MTAGRVAKADSGRRVQLHRALSKLGWGSRTQAWDWIRSGQVCVDDQVVTDPLTWVDLDRQQIRRGRRDAPVKTPVVLALHKPRGVITTRQDERGRRTVYDLLPPDMPWLFPVGRLDADTEGLLIFTNDASLAVRLTEPDHGVAKTYVVTLRGVPSAAALEQARSGVPLADGPTRPAQVRVLDECGKGARLEMVLWEGRNRQIRRTWAALGHKVSRLIRVAVGRFTLGDLPPSGWQILPAQDVRRLQESVGPAPGTGSHQQRPGH